MTTDYSKYPAFISGANAQKYIDIYDETEEGLREESKHLSDNPTLKTLIERISTVYVTIRFREDNRWPNGPQEQKEYNANYMNLVKEFNKVIQTSQDKKRDQLKENLIVVVQSVINKHVEGNSEKKAIFEDIADGLQKRGI